MRASRKAYGSNSFFQSYIKFIETMFDHCFYSLINKPTHIINSSATVLDNVWTNIYSYIIKLKILLYFISDPLPLLVVSSWQFISLLFSQHKKLNDRIKTTSEKGMQVTKRIDVKHTQIF